MKLAEPVIECVSSQSITRWRDGHWLGEAGQPGSRDPGRAGVQCGLACGDAGDTCDLEYFALGFALSEGIVANRAEFHHAEAEASELGITLHCEISGPAFMKLQQRRRNMTGRTGCGLCGVESLQQVFRPLPALTAGAPLSVTAMRAALRSLAAMQPLNRLTGGMHAAAWSAPDGSLQHVCEDVGRHNALDKLIGKMAERALGFHDGFLLITSRASVEMAQKAATVGMGV